MTRRVFPPLPWYVRPGLAAAHLIEHAGRAAFVDVGTTRSVPDLLTALDRLGVPRAAVDYVFVTHVHLDHAGGAGWLMQELPNAQAVLHSRGAPHLIAPEKLIAASRVVYGDAVHTPGHALHHHCIVDLDHAGIFTGNTVGLSYRALDTAQGAFIVPTSTPTQSHLGIHGGPRRLLAWSIAEVDLAIGPDGR